MALGDLYMIWDKENTASDRYKEAWQALSGDPTLEEKRDEYFARPVRILGPAVPTIFPPPSRNAPPPAMKDLEPGFVVVRFNVDQFGHVSDATIVEADPANLLEDRVVQVAKKSLFRPRYEAGAPMATTGLTVRHEFRYAPKKTRKEGGTTRGRGQQAAGATDVRGGRLKPLCGGSAHPTLFPERTAGVRLEYGMNHVCPGYCCSAS